MKQIGIGVGVLMVGLLLPVLALEEDFESDTVGEIPHALLWATQQVTVVAAGTDGIDTPDCSAKYVKAVYDKTGWNALYWGYAEGSASKSIMGDWVNEVRSIPDSIEGDLYIDVSAPRGGGTISATIVFDDGTACGAYKGEYHVGYYKDTDGLIHVGVDSKMPPYYTSKLPGLVSGWYHFKMMTGDADADGMVDFTGIMTDSIGNVLWSGIKKTSLPVASHFMTGAQVFLVKSGVVVRVDNLKTSANQPPEAMAFVDPAGGTTDDEFYFSAADSYDPDGTIVAYEWQINDTVVSTTEDFLYTFAAGGTYTVTLTVMDNSGLTDSDTLQVNVSEPVLPEVSVTASDSVAGEPGLTEDVGKFTVRRSGDLTTTIFVNYTMSGTAANGTDYTLLTGTAKLAAGKAWMKVTVRPEADALKEGDETVILTLQSGSGYKIDGAKASGVVTIKDQTYDTPVVTATATDATAVEPSLTTVDTGRIKISRMSSCHAPLTVMVALTGTAENGVDYTKVVTSVVLAAGQSAKTITIAPMADAVVESDEAVILTILPDAAYLIGAGQESATVTIKDNTLLDTPVMSIVAKDATAAEPKPGVTNNGKLTIRRTSQFHAPLVVNYTVSGTATNGQDYHTLTGSVNFPAGVAEKTLTITPKADALVEGLETVIVTISASGSYTIDAAKGAATVTIAD